MTSPRPHEETSSAGDTTTSQAADIGSSMASTISTVFVGPKMQVDSDSLKVDEALYAEPLECMMVETTDGLVEVSKATSLAESFEVMMVKTTEGFISKAERRSESAYPQAGESLSDFQAKCKENGSKALLCPKCSVVFNEKTIEKLEANNKALKEEKPVSPQFVFNKHGTPRRNKDYGRQFQRSRPKTFIPPTDVPQEKWIESVNQKGGKKPKWRVLKKETTSSYKKGGYTTYPNKRNRCQRS